MDATLGPTHDHVVLTLRLPDRPGALGSVASRIGAIGADITDVTIRRRGDGLAEDILHLDLPLHDDLDVVGLLLAEIGHVDGVVSPSVRHPGDASCCVQVPAASDRSRGDELTNGRRGRA